MTDFADITNEEFRLAAHTELANLSNGSLVRRLLLARVEQIREEARCERNAAKIDKLERMIDSARAIILSMVTGNNPQLIEQCDKALAALTWDKEAPF